MKSSSGTYTLVLKNDAGASIQIGKWGRLDIEPGYYLYVGSAFGPGGVLARVSRHCREAKSKHWHIDYLREFTSLKTVWYSHAQERLEHSWAKALEGVEETESIRGFGCSDCNCESHLFFVAREPVLKKYATILCGGIRSWACESIG
jgi:Uri superfamily endonuclease